MLALDVVGSNERRGYVMGLLGNADSVDAVF